MVVGILLSFREAFSLGANMLVSGSVHNLCDSCRKPTSFTATSMLTSRLLPRLIRRIPSFWPLPMKPFTSFWRVKLGMFFFGMWGSQGMGPEGMDGMELHKNWMGKMCGKNVVRRDWDDGAKTYVVAWRCMLIFDYRCKGLECLYLRRFLVIFHSLWSRKSLERLFPMANKS